MNSLRAVIKNSNMSEEMQQDAVEIATNALEKYDIEKVRIGIGYSIAALFL